jgi:DnaJ-domain-containing protein 1
VEFVFIFVLSIVALSYGYKLLRLRMLQQDKRERDSATRLDVAGRFAQLEERVRVLERIVTDDSAHLKRQFRELGD